MWPVRKRAGFETHHVDLIPPELEFLDQWTRFNVNLSPPDELAVAVKHADSDFFKEMSGPRTLRMVRSFL